MIFDIVMVKVALKHKYKILLVLCILSYIIYFSYFSILRMHTLYASYFDLGIMHQTVYNTYRALVTGDMSRFLEFTNPHGFEQVKRMAIHNDILLALLAPFYFIYNGPETLLVIQTVVLALGAYAVFQIALFVFEKFTYKHSIALVFSLAYLLYSPMQRANNFDFHPVTLATSLLLFMFYFFLRKQYWISGLFFLLSLISKEQVSLTTTLFGIYILYYFAKTKISNRKRWFPLAIVGISIIWFLLSLYIIIPYFHKGAHFALGKFSDFGESPKNVFIGIFKNPIRIFYRLIERDSLRYFWFLLGPLGFLSLFSPLTLAIALPEFAINILSNDGNMRNVIYHYTSVIQPFVFISAIYGSYYLITRFKTIHDKKKTYAFVGMIVLTSFFFSYFKSPLPYSREKEIHPFVYPQKEIRETETWSKALKNEKLKISSIGHLAPFFTSRRYFYNFSQYYPLADYIVLRLNEIYTYPEKDVLIPVYETLRDDANFKLVYKGENFEVYKKQ